MRLETDSHYTGRLSGQTRPSERVWQKMTKLVTMKDKSLGLNTLVCNISTVTVVLQYS